MTSAPPDLPRLRVLVASDLDAMRTLFRECLPARDYDLFFDDGSEDLSDFAQWAEPQVIFLALEDAHASADLYHRLRSFSGLVESAIAVISPPAADPALFTRGRRSRERVLLVPPSKHEIAAFVWWHAQRLHARPAGRHPAGGEGLPDIPSLADGRTGD